MPSISTEQGSLHYEVSGKGPPVILLHGYQGSWGLWRPTMEFLESSKRTYAVDFWGFGESGARRSSYRIQDFVDLVADFMAQMGISSAPIVGHSMGGTVALMVAAKYPGCVTRLAVISAPIVGSSLRFFPRVFGIRQVAWFTHRNLWLYRLMYRLLARAYSSEPGWPDMMDRDISQIHLEAFFASIGSLRRIDLRSSLPAIRVPVLGMYGELDNIVDPDQWQLLRAGFPQAEVDRFPGCRHFIMLDAPKRFMTRLKAFLDE